MVFLPEKRKVATFEMHSFLILMSRVYSKMAARLLRSYGEDISTQMLDVC